MSSVGIDNRLELNRESQLVALAAALLAVLSLAYCTRNSLLLLYGDAVAHLHIARRVFDSLNPGFRQLGSVWLPFPHLVLIPFVMKLGWWQSGLAGAIPSMCCYVVACAGIYRLARIWLSQTISWVAAAFFVLNPGLLYMQTTAMTEPLFLAEVIWATLLTAECLQAIKSRRDQEISRKLTSTGLILVAAVFTRYDGWIFAALAWLVLAGAIARSGRCGEILRSRAGGAFVLFTVMLATAPALWIAYNAKQFHDPFDFTRGPYSARAIEERTATPGMPHHPGWHSLKVSAIYYLKAAELGATSLRFANTLLYCAIAGTILAVLRWREGGISATLLLWFPLPFYAYSVAYGSVPIFIPLWWPQSFYNTRYGMEMLPVFALMLAFLVDGIGRLVPRVRGWIAAVAIAVVLWNSVDLARATPLVLQEAIANSRTRIPFEQALARALGPVALIRPGMILIYTSDHIGALQRAGIPLRRTINEGDYYQWPGALADPAKAAGIVVAIDGDEVAKAVAAHPAGLTLDRVICSSGQPCARIYLSNSASGSETISR